MTTNSVPLPPIVKSIEVAVPPERAFAAFTSEIHRWWPLETHALSAPDAVFCALEPRVGGRVFERDRRGLEQDWGTVLAWDPPKLVRFTWRLGRAAGSSQEVEVRFVPRGASTVVTLVHSGFELEEQHRNYNGGWEHVLQRFVSRAGEPAGI